VADSTLWALKPHTKAKHDLLKNYLAAWFPILSSVSNRILYIDGFAGPGIYSSGELGSPVYAIKTAYEHMLKDKFKEIVFLFIEKRKDRAEKLKEVLRREFPDLPNDNIKYFVVSDEFDRTLDKLLADLDSQSSSLAPTFAFIDPFGYSGFPMDLMERLLAQPKCEIFITFMSGFIKRFLDEGKEEVLTKLFNSTEWMDIKKSQNPKDQQVLDLYIKQLKKCCSVEHVKSFKMINKFNMPIYHLVFCTSNIKGLEVMKKAMWNVDITGEYKFADNWDEKQSFLFEFSDKTHWIPQAARAVYNEFQGRTTSIPDINRYVIAETPFLFYKSILQYIENNIEGSIANVILDRKRRRGSFPDDCFIVFNPS